MVDIDCYAVNMVELCVRSRTLLVAGTSHVIVYQFSTVEETLELVVSSIFGFAFCNNIPGPFCGSVFNMDEYTCNHANFEICPELQAIAKMTNMMNFSQAMNR